MEKSNVTMRQNVTSLDRLMEWLGFRETGSCKERYDCKVLFPVSHFYREVFLWWLWI